MAPARVGLGLALGSRNRWLALASGLAFGLYMARRHTRFALSNKNALITGGARGLGLEIARVLVNRGANVAIVARDQAEIDRALADLASRKVRPGLRILGRVCDLRDAAAVDDMLADVRAKLGPIDVLVNNAGTIQVGPLAAMNVEDFDDAMKLHCFAPLRLMLALRDDMRARGGGRIANIASIGGITSIPHLLPYSASKFALVGLSQGMQAELAADGIYVSTVAPGLMRTGSTRRARFRGDHRKEYAWFSVAGSLPLLSMSSTRAARRVVSALEHGEPHVVLGAPAKLLAIANGIAPNLVAHALRVTNALLPQSSDAREYAGFESESNLVPHFLTALSDRAAARNNER